MWYSLQEREDFNEIDFKIQLYTPPKKIESPAEFISGCVKQMVGTIRDTQPVRDYFSIMNANPC